MAFPFTPVFFFVKYPAKIKLKGFQGVQPPES